MCLRFSSFKYLDLLINNKFIVLAYHERLNCFWRAQWEKQMFHFPSNHRIIPCAYIGLCTQSTNNNYPKIDFVLIGQTALALIAFRWVQLWSGSILCDFENCLCCLISTFALPLYAHCSVLARAFNRFMCFGKIFRKTLLLFGFPHLAPSKNRQKGNLSIFFVSNCETVYLDVIVDQIERRAIYFECDSRVFWDIIEPIESGKMLSFFKWSSKR